MIGWQIPKKILDLFLAVLYNIFIYYIYLPLYIHVARDTATDAAVVGHYKGGCTCVFNGAELLN